MITNLKVSPRILGQIERQLRSGGRPITAEAFVKQGFPLVEILGALFALEESGRAYLSVEGETLWLLPKGDVCLTDSRR